MEGQNPTIVEIKLPKTPYNFTRFYTLMSFLQKWRNADQEDTITLDRNQMIEIIEGVNALRTALEAIHEEVGTSTKASMIARTALFQDQQGQG